MIAHEKARPFDTMYTVYGGQFGSEGKGNICHYLADQIMVDLNPQEQILAYRIGGPNAGHTFYLDKGHTNFIKIVTCQIPGPMFVSPRVIGIIGPEGVIDLEKLQSELDQLSLIHSDDTIKPFLLIDNSAVIISPSHKSMEQNLVNNIGSTGKGVGRATADKVMRFGVDTAGLSEKLHDLRIKMHSKVTINVVDTIAWLDAQVQLRGKPFPVAIVEGTQGTELSLHTSGFYPYCTSRECTPQGIWAGCGLHPKMAHRSISIMVVRTYPIRVAGNSGPLHNEIDWDILSKRLGKQVTEQTTVTKKTRRVGEMDFYRLKRAVQYTRPDVIAMTFLDYIVPDAYGKDFREYPQLLEYIQHIEDQTGVPVTIGCTGPHSVYSMGIRGK